MSDLKAHHNVCGVTMSRSNGAQHGMPEMMQKYGCTTDYFVVDFYNIHI